MRPDLHDHTQSPSLSDESGRVQKLEISAPPEGILFDGETGDEGKIAVVYNGGEAPPKITVMDSCDRVQTVLANGIAVAVVVRPKETPLKPDDVMLLERLI